MMYLQGTFERFITLALIGIILAVVVSAFRSVRRTEEWERRIIILVLFFAIHELTFFLEDAFISQLTNMLFVISLLYALLYVFSFEKKLAEIEEQRKEFLSGLEELRNMKELREKLKK